MPGHQGGVAEIDDFGSNRSDPAHGGDAIPRDDDEPRRDDAAGSHIEHPCGLQSDDMLWSCDLSEGAGRGGGGRESSQ